MQWSRSLAMLPVLGLFGCALAHPQLRHAGDRPRAASKASGRAEPKTLTGIWDWVFRSANEQGDLRIEQEEWHLNQEGTRLSGYYDRQVVTLSTDQRPFRCNGALGFTKNTRVRVRGEVVGNEIQLREIAADSQQHPCDDGNRRLMHYIGQLRGDSLLLRFAPGGTQFLTRRIGTGPEPGEGALSQTATVSASEGASVPLAGVWAWELSTVDAEGDLRVEREEWHLSESDSEISGYYERSVSRTRPDGVFPCNGAPSIDTVTRYTIKGQRFGERISLSEIDFSAQPSACDNALRRLDSYRGILAPSGQELTLSWGQGSQVLRRRP